jgi:hypothetical protein
VFLFMGGLREERGGESCEDVGRRFTRLAAGNELGARLACRMPPPGAVRGGPLARMQAESLVGSTRGRSA